MMQRAAISLSRRGGVGTGTVVIGGGVSGGSTARLCLRRLPLPSSPYATGGVGGGGIGLWDRWCHHGAIGGDGTTAGRNSEDRHEHEVPLLSCGATGNEGNEGDGRGARFARSCSSTGARGRFSPSAASLRRRAVGENWNASSCYYSSLGGNGVGVGVGVGGTEAFRRVSAGIERRRLQKQQRRSLFGWGGGGAGEKGAVVAAKEDVDAGVESSDAATFTSALEDNTVLGAGPGHASALPSSFASSVDSFDSNASHDTTLDAASDAATTAAATTTSSFSSLPWNPDWYWPPDQIINVVNYVHDSTGWTYAASIAALTVAIRVAVFPLFVAAQRNSARMAHMKPEMDLLKARIDAMTERGQGGRVDPDEQVRLTLQMRALFKKYDCNPLKAFVVPLVQGPLFMSMFFGLRKMPDYFSHDLSTGGILWFTDLTAHDPYFIMPVASGLTFIGMMELGKEQMLANNRKQGEIMLNVFRVLGVVFVGVTWNFPTVIFCYWMTNNSLSLVQAMLFKNSAVKKKLGIWDLPQPVPGTDDGTTSKGIIALVQDLIKPSESQVRAERIKLHNEAVDKQKQAKAGRNRKMYRGSRGRSQGGDGVSE